MRSYIILNFQASIKKVNKWLSLCCTYSVEWVTAMENNVASIPSKMTNNNKIGTCQYKNTSCGGKTGRADKMDKILWVDGG